MSHRLASCFGAAALLFAAAAIAPAQAKFVPGLGEVSDCMPGVTGCGANRPITVTRAVAVDQCRPWIARGDLRVFHNCVVSNVGRGTIFCGNGKTAPIINGRAMPCPRQWLISHKKH